MIDWHSHVLPSMDDGSRDVEESLAMLGALKKQGATHVIATPHFYAADESQDRFLARRSRAYETLLPHLTDEHPQLLCGAEVRYYAGICRMEGLDRLTIENTNMLLLEMPEERWTEYTVKELVELSNTRGLTVVLAHIERYLPQQARGVFDRLLEVGIKMQINATLFGGFFDRRAAVNMLKTGRAHFIGSDCHNMSGRPPRLNLAYDYIGKRLGEDFVLRMNAYGYRALKLNV